MRKRKVVGLISLLLFLFGFLIPEEFIIPVEKADKNSFNHKAFWYYPWGKSITHKGIDIFANEKTPVLSSTGGIVVFHGEIQMGGRVVVILGPKWKLYYYAHLNDINASLFSITKKGERIGSVGTTGNAKGKQPHLHYSIITLVPYIWRIDGDRQGWKKMFYLNPIDYLNND